MFCPDQLNMCTWFDSVSQSITGKRLPLIISLPYNRVFFILEDLVISKVLSQEILLKNSFVPIHLQEFLLTLHFLVPKFLYLFRIFFHSWFGWHNPPLLNFFTFFFALQFGISFHLDSSKFSRLKLSSWIQPMCLDIRNFLLLYRNQVQNGMGKYN